VISSVNVRRAAVGALLGAVAVIHWPGLETGFLSDDFMILSHLHREGWAGDWTRPFLNLTGVLFYRPVLTGSYALDHLVYGLDPWGFHFTNLLLHLLVTMLILHVGRMLTGRWSVGWIAAALVGLSPLNPNTVTWIAGRVSLLGSVFPLFAILGFLAARRRRDRLSVVVMVAGLVAGLLAKESALVVPFFLLLADLVLPGRRAGWRLHVLLWSVLALGLGLRRAVLGVFLGGYGAVESETARSFGWHLFELAHSVLAALVPFETVTAGRPVPGSAWVVLAVIATLVVLWFVRGATGRRALIVALLWAGGMTALHYPAWGLDPANAERWYPALLGGSLALAVLLGSVGRTGAVAAAILVAVGLPTLWREEMECRTTGARVRALLAVAGKAGEASAPVVVHNLPLIRGAVPFLHFGLADALAPPFQNRRVEVYAVHTPYVEVEGAPNPVAYLMARDGPVTLLECDPAGEGTITHQVGRDTLLAYEGFKRYRDAPALVVDTTPAAWTGKRFRVRVEAPPSSHLHVFLFTPAGAVHVRRTVPSGGVWEEELGAAFADFMNYPGHRRGFLVVAAYDQRRQLVGLTGRWIARAD